MSATALTLESRRGGRNDVVKRLEKIRAQTQHEPPNYLDEVLPWQRRKTLAQNTSAKR
jgi:hypothetical protein